MFSKVPPSFFFDELKCYNSVSYKLRSLKCEGKGGEYHCSHSSHLYFKMLLAYYCDTQKQSSGELAKIHRKATVSVSLISQSHEPIKKQTPCERLIWILSCFFQAVVLYMHSRNNWKFSIKAYFSNNRVLFAAYVWLLNHEAKAC